MTRVRARDCAENRDRVRGCLLAAATLGWMLLVSCASAPPDAPKSAPLVSNVEPKACDSTPRQEPKLVPWDGLREPTFQELLVSFGDANLHVDPDKTLARYFWSQPNSYARYRASMDAGGDITPLMKEATLQIQAGAAKVACEQFIAETYIPLLPYDSARGGFPVNAVAYHDLVQPQAIVNPDSNYGYRRSQIRLPGEGWMLPATQEQAQQLWQAIWDPVIRGKRFLHGIGVYTLDRCDQDPQQHEVLQCTGTLRKFYAYARPPLQPVYELVKDAGRSAN